MISFAECDKTGCSSFMVFKSQHEVVLLELNGGSPI